MEENYEKTENMEKTGVNSVEFEVVESAEKRESREREALRGKYRTLAELKVLVDKYFNDAQNGKKRVHDALVFLKSEIAKMLEKIQ